MKTRPRVITGSLVFILCLGLLLPFSFAANEFAPGIPPGQQREKPFNPGKRGGQNSGGGGTSTDGSGSSSGSGGSTASGSTGSTTGSPASGGSITATGATPAGSSGTAAGTTGANSGTPTGTFIPSNSSTSTGSSAMSGFHQGALSSSRTSASGQNYYSAFKESNTRKNEKESNRRAKAAKATKNKNNENKMHQESLPKNSLARKLFTDPNAAQNEKAGEFLRDGGDEDGFPDAMTEAVEDSDEMTGENLEPMDPIDAEQQATEQEVKVDENGIPQDEEGEPVDRELEKESKDRADSQEKDMKAKMARTKKAADDAKAGRPETEASEKDSHSTPAQTASKSKS